MLLRGELLKYAKNSNFENFESALYSISGSMPLMQLCDYSRDLKGIVSDSNNIFLWHGSEDILQKEKGYFQNFSWFQFYVYKLHNYVHWHCSIYNVFNCVKLSLINENLCENCSYFTLKWFLHNFFGDVCFLEKNYKFNIMYAKNPYFDIFEWTSIWNLGVFLLTELCLFITQCFSFKITPKSLQYHM